MCLLCVWCVCVHISNSSRLIIKNLTVWEFPRILWLEVSAFIASGLSSVPGWATKILQAMRCNQKNLAIFPISFIVSEFLCKFFFFKLFLTVFKVLIAVIFSLSNLDILKI